MCASVLQDRRIVLYWRPKFPWILRHGSCLVTGLIIPFLLPLPGSTCLGVYCACWHWRRREGLDWSCVVYGIQDTCEWSHSGPVGTFQASNQCTMGSWIAGSLSPLSPYRGTLLTMDSVLSKGPYGFYYLCLLTSSMYHCWVMGVSGGVSLSLIYLKCFRELLVWSWRDGISGAVPSISCSSKGVFSWYFRRSSRGAIIGGAFSDILIMFPISFIDIFQALLFG